MPDTVPTDDEIAALMLEVNEKELAAGNARLDADEARERLKVGRLARFTADMAELGFVPGVWVDARTWRGTKPVVEAHIVTGCGYRDGSLCVIVAEPKKDGTPGKRTHGFAPSKLTPRHPVEAA